MKSIFVKQFSGYLLIVVLFAASILYFTYDEVEKDFQKKKISELNKINNLVAYVLTSNNYNNLQLEIQPLANAANIRITIIDSKGIVLADSEDNPASMENHSDRPEFISAITNRNSYSIRHSKTLSDNMLYVAKPVFKGGSLIYVLRSSVHLKDINILIASLQNQLIYILLGISIISIIFSIIYSKLFTRPINELIRVSEEIALGNFDVKSHVNSNDELGSLSASINEMISRIKELFAKVNRKKDELNNIISSINEGLAVFTSEGKLILSNSNFRSIMKFPDGANVQFFEILRNEKLIRQVKKLISKERLFNIEIEINGEHYICGGNIINEKRDIALILHNITELKKLQDIKKDFVVNVSHELRTPLTVIKGYIETMADNINGDNSRHLEIINRHTNRLINIVNDLLLLSEMESKEKLNIDDVNISETINDIAEGFKQRIEEKNLEIKINNAVQNPIVKADRFKLEQLFINLIDNAIKYTEKGGITINFEDNQANLAINIRDTGIGIPPQEKDRIFERFYTIDKSHSRQKSGTGLGLSIVKHIVLAHKGTIQVESELGKGSSFIVSLPKQFIPKS